MNKTDKKDLLNKNQSTDDKDKETVTQDVTAPAENTADTKAEESAAEQEKLSEQKTDSDNEPAMDISPENLSLRMKLMDDDEKLISEIMLDPDEEGLGFGDDAVQPWKNIQKEKTHNIKKIIIIVAAAFLAAILIIVGITTGMSIHKTKLATPAPLDASKFPTIFFDMSGNVNVKPHSGAGYTAMTFAATPSEEFAKYIRTNNDGSKLFFADSADAVSGSPYDLYYRSAKSSGTKTENADEEETQDAQSAGIYSAKRIAKSVQGEFKVSNNGKYVAYLKEKSSGKGKLYVNDLLLETVIEEHDVVDFNFSNDNNYIMYSKNSGEAFDTVYIKKLGDNSQKVRLDNNVVKIISYNDDLSRIYYLKQSDLEKEEENADTASADNADTAQQDGMTVEYIQNDIPQTQTDSSTMEKTPVICSLKLKVTGRDPIVIIDGVINVSDITERGNFAFVMENITELTYDDLVEDEFVETDELVKKPDPQEYNVTSYVDVDENGDGVVEKKQVTKVDTESYNRALNLWQEKENRENTRKTLKSRNVEISNLGLYCFINGSVVQISNDCEQYYPIDIDTGAIAYIKRETESVKRYAITELVGNTELMFNQTGKGEVKQLYYCYNGNSRELSRAYDSSSIVCRNGKMLYLTDYDEGTGKGTLYSINANSESVKLADDVNSFAVNEDINRYAYVSSAVDGYGSLFVMNEKYNRTLISDQVAVDDGYIIDDKGNVAARDNAKNSLIYWNGRKVSVIAENPLRYDFRDTGKLVFIANGSDGTENTLARYDGNKVDEIIGGVACYIFPY